MADSQFYCAPLCLKGSAADLARRLSSIQQYLPAAQQLAAIEHLSPNDLECYSRKIVALIEVSRDTLRRYGLRLYQFASCAPCLVPHKKAHFNLLRILKQKRCFMSDTNVQGRMDRLLIPLSTNLRIVTPENTRISLPATSPSASFSASQLPSQSSALFRRSPTDTACSSDASGLMLPPDVLLARARAKAVSRTANRQWNAQRGRPRKRILVYEPEARQPGEASGRPRIVIQQPPRRFGILHTGKYIQRRTSAL